MLGYFRPITKQLSKDDQALYRSLYCSLCHTIKDEYGRLTTLFLQYDLIFFLMCSGKLEQVDVTQTKRVGCTAFPLVKVTTLADREAIKPFADLSVFTNYTAHLNKVTDGKGSRFGRQTVQFLFSAAFEQSATSLGLTGRVEQLKAFLSAEKEVDQVPDQIIAPICEFYSDMIVRTLGLGDAPYREIAYHMCRVMYYLDAIEDFWNDRKDDQFNILNCVFHSPEQAVHYVQMRVYDSLHKVQALAPSNRYRRLIDHILMESVGGQFAAAKQRFLELKR